ncbi:Diguanylate cyclase/phosphodiesterase with GAF sensor [Moritella viscosa]|uniref:sensor domain-containing diguanylate cyclase n=1 Tax=Moritella viscosa TaxID=80854 RepID=UPI000509135D|nr:diguanylate cyclase [Moritella viscosa]CED60615.1 putative membrane associated signaling protein, GGDEF family protein [Moritella viscosa]SHO12623.1 Diguanylate cyclase/phosphodiesterase with GAF sensor [Moritella viscosa]SHO23125.1 Diguanylate cyclase/phosphodiesterase with GAF sensor [Moritella viscosa]
MGKKFRCSINNAKQAVIATFIALALVVSGVVAIATPITYGLVWNALFDVAMEQNEQQALKFKALADTSIRQGIAPEDVVKQFQSIFQGSSYDPSNYVCLINENGEVIAHPEITYVGSVIDISYQRKEEALPELRSSYVNISLARPGLDGDFSADNLPSRNVVKYMANDNMDAIFQYPLHDIGATLWIHIDVAILDKKTEKVMISIGYVIIPALLIIIAIGTFAVRIVEGSFESKLEKKAHTDGLTGLANRRYFDVQLKKEWKRALRSGGSLSLAMLDIDYFKLYNDNYGHQAGDDAIKKVADCLKMKVQRASDTVARYGGEEFAIVMVDCTEQEAVFFMEKLVLSIENLGILHANSSCSKFVTCSMGLATLKASQDVDYSQLLRLADRALYRSKAKGRNNLCR